MGKINGRVLQQQQRGAVEDALEDAVEVTSLSASPGGTWAGGNPSPPSGDTTPAPLLGLHSSTDPASPLPSEKHNSPQNLTLKNSGLCQSLFRA